MNLRRREFLRTLGGSTAGLALCAGSKHAKAQGASISDAATVPVPELVNGSVQINGSVKLPPANASGVEHIVVVMMENRSFDHFLGWLPGADARQSGLTYVDVNGIPQQTWLLAPDFGGCGYHDPDHSYAGSRVAYNGGAMDGFLRAGENDLFSIGYYAEADLPFFSALARNFLACDRYFASILGATFSNRMFMWSAKTDRLSDDVAFSSLPTIFDRLQDAGVSHRYYFNNLPYLALWGFKYLWSTGLFGDFLADAGAGTLPAVSFIDPAYTIFDDGTGNDDHPHADIRNGEAFLSEVYRAVTTGPEWPNTVLIITFDEGGGFFEHVTPPRVVAANELDTDQVNGGALLGFRIPAVIVSPFTLNTTGNPQVSHTVYDHTSVLKLIEWRWGLPPLTPRDASPQIGNPATSMNFALPSVALPAVPAPGGVFALPCFEGGIFNSDAVVRPNGRNNGAPRTEWGALAAMPHAQQWLQYLRFRERFLFRFR